MFKKFTALITALTLLTAGLLPLSAFADGEVIRPVSASTLAISEDKWHANQGDASKIIDGNDNTFFMRKWLDVATAATFEFTLENYSNLTAARIVWGGRNASFSSVANSYALYGSADGVYYRKLYEVSGLTARGEDYTRTDEFALANAAGIKYLRLNAYGQIPSQCLALAEISFTGTSGTAPEAGMSGLTVTASQGAALAANLIDGNKDTIWKSGEWERGSEGNAEHSDIVLTIALPKATDLRAVDFSLVSYFPENVTDYYNRESRIEAYEVAVSANGTDYRTVYRFDGTMHAIYGNREALQTEAASVTAFDGSVRGVKYVKLIFKNVTRLAISELQIRGDETVIRPTAASTRAISQDIWHGDQGNISKIIDGKDNTFFMRTWTGIPNVVSFDLTLDEVYDLDTARIVWGGSYTSSAVATSYDVYVSADGLVYTKAASVTDGAAAGEDHRRTDITEINAQKVKYVRLCVYGQNPESCLAISEVSFNGSPSALTDEKIYPTEITASQGVENYPTSNLTDGSAETYWRIGEWEAGSEGNAEHEDTVLTAVLPHVTDISSVDFSLVSYFPDGTTEHYNRNSTINAYEIEVSADGINYRNVYRFDGTATAIHGTEAYRTEGFSAKNFTGSVAGVKYVRITFKKYSRLALNDLCVRGTDSENGLKMGDVQIRLAHGTTRSGMHFTVEANKAAFGIEGTFALNDPTLTAGVMLLSKATLQESGFATIAARAAAGTTSGIIDLTAAEILAQDAQSFTYAAVRTQIPLNEFNTVYAIVPYVKNGSTYTFGKQTEASYAGLKTVGNFLYPTEGTWEVKSEDFARTIGSKTYLDVAAAASVTPVTNDWSALLPEDEENYYFAENTVCPVDADTLYRVIEADCTGAGALKWKDFQTDNWQQNSDPFVGTLPISKINDPLYLQLCLPHERNSFSNTKNGNNNFEVLNATAGNLTALCAIYLDPEKEINDDAVITLCFGEMKMALRKNDGNGWYTAVNSTGPDGTHPGPADLGNIYPIPWTLENDANPVKPYNIGRNKVTWVNDHYEVPVTAADLRGKKFTDPRVTSAVFHTWSTFYNFDATHNIEGIATAYTVWVKEPQWSGYLTADTGADVRQDGQYCHQTFSSRYFVVTNQPKMVYGHNVGPNRYDTIMDSATVQQLLGIN